MPRQTKASPNQQVLDLLESAPEVEPASTDGLFAPLDDARETYNLCFWGREGSGKTTALATAANCAPEGSRVLIVNAEGGLKKKALQRLGIDTTKIVIWPNPDKPVRITQKSLDAVYRALAGDLERDPKSWYAVGWDSASEIHEQITGYVAEHRIERARKRDVTVDEVDEFFTDRDDYGTMSKMVRDLLRKFRDLPCHFVVTALERRDVDEKTSKVTYGPAVTPGLQSAVLGSTDVNLFFKQEDEEGPFRALASRSAMYRVKDRIGLLPRVLADPSFERILGYINGELSEDTDPLQKTLPAPKAAREPVSGKKPRRNTTKEEKEPSNEQA